MQSKAIVLRTFRYNDESFIAHLLTEQSGCVAMMVRISRSRRAAVKHTLFQPLAVLNVEWEDKPRASLQRPRAAQALLPFSSLPYEPHKLAIGLFLADFLYHAVRSEPDTAAIFAYVSRSLEWLDTCTTGFANFHLVFLLRLTHFLGFMPNLEEAKAGDWFDLRASCFVPERPLHPDFLEPQDAALLPKLMRMRYDNMRFFRFSGEERTRLLHRINDYYRLHLPDFPELKSLDVLSNLFGPAKS